MVRSFRSTGRGATAGAPGVADEITGDFVDVLLGLDGDDKMSDSDMIAVLWVRSTLYV